MFLYVYWRTTSASDDDDDDDCVEANNVHKSSQFDIKFWHKQNNKLKGTATIVASTPRSKAKTLTPRYKKLVEIWNTTGWSLSDSELIRDLVVLVSTQLALWLLANTTHGRQETSL